MTVTRIEEILNKKVNKKIEKRKLKKNKSEIAKSII